MARYQITEEDLAYAQEFMETPIGYHSPGLQRVLNRMRGADWTRRYVLVIEERYRLWRLAQLPVGRGAQVEIIEGVVYTDLVEAERDIFRRRWKDLTGQDLDTALSQTT